MTFKDWLLNCSDYSKHGWLVSDIESDKTFPNTGSHLEMMVYLVGNKAGEASLRMFDEAWKEYKEELRK